MYLGSSWTCTNVTNWMIYLIMRGGDWRYLGTIK